MYSLVWIFILLGLSVAVIGTSFSVNLPESDFHSYDDTHTLCAYYAGSNVKQHNGTAGNYVDANNTAHCSKASDTCFILWTENPKNKSITILTQGCWDSNDNNCKKNECIAYPKQNKAKNTSFCCCTGNFCNSNITDGYFKDADITEKDPQSESVNFMSYTMQVVIAIVSTIALLVLVTIIYLLSHIYRSNPKPSNDSVHLIETGPPNVPNVDLNTLQIQKESIGQGGFGSVYCGTLKDRTVAVKIYSYKNREYFFNEREVYMLPHMKHPSIPEYLGYQERIGKDERPEFLIVLSYCPLGCLQNFLKERTIDWIQLCKMSLSIACGLAHLHTEIEKDGKSKSCIAHRDMTSRNILMKADGTCMICDFGFALQVSGSKYIVNGNEEQAETYSLTEVGTLRYKAPELLELSVNLRDLESSLKQIDIYALGLILWEIATRCSDLYQGLEVPSYKLPFEAEVGAHATTEQIQNIVVKRKARPLFPDIWKDTNPAIQSLKETIEDCWDQDADARLTALCVEERLSELPELCKRYKAGVGGILPSPTSNLCKSGLQKKSSNDINIDCCDNDQLICPRERANSLSECTVETLLSPTSEAINCKNNIINSSSPPIKVTVPLQPYQGRNPCLARNLMQTHTDDPPVIGNSLQDGKSKFPHRKFYSFSDGDGILSVPNGNTGNSYLINSTNRVCNPIPYVQNQVNGIPKKTNVNGNVSKDFLNKIAGLIGSLNRKTSGSCNLPEEQQLLKNSAISSPISPSDTDIKQGQINPVENWFSNGKENNSDKIINCNGHKPINGMIDSCIVTIDGDKNAPKTNSYCNGKLPSDDKIKHPTHLQNGIFASDRSKRPTTLPVQPLTNGLDSTEMPEVPETTATKVENEPPSLPENPKVVVRRRGSGSRRKGVKRVQTPYEITGRFSLIDDRIMSSQELPTVNASNGTSPQSDNVKLSVSVPNMNTICAAGPPSQAPSKVLHEKLNEKTEMKEIPKSKPLNGLIVPVSQNGYRNVLVV